jgi:peptide/nickel transport system permease protein
MIKFLLRRTFLGVFVMWLMTIFVFVIFFVAPNHVARAIAGKQATPARIAAVNHRLGLDQSKIEQYYHFLDRLVHGNLGFDFYHQIPVNTIIGNAFPKTFSLAIGAAVIWLVIGLFSGVVSATHPRSLADRGLTGFALFFYSLPTFLLGLVLLYLVYFRLTLAGFSFFPPGSYIPFTSDPGDWARHLILPWFTLALVLAATYTRLTRGSLLDVLGEDYIRTARSKGLRESRVTYRHGLRSALTPVVTQFGVDLGQLVGGVVVTETVFSIDGLGYEAIHAIDVQDLPVIVGIVILAAAFVIVANIVVDVMYAVLDPRVRLN